MKKLFSFMMALVLVLSLSVNAFAAENTGSITITNATKGDTYSLYHIFDASYSTNAAGNADSVIYSIKTDNPFFAYMFEDEDGNVVGNSYFSHALKEGTTDQYIVAKKDETITDAQIISYLTEMVRSKKDDGTAKFEAVATGKLADAATDANLMFSNLPYGYYLIDKGVGAAVTIDSNTPDVDVIDKNQIPGNNFDKLLKTDALDEDGNPIEWASGNSASVGDMVEWQVKFTATNYDGDDIVQYYAITDEKSSPLWVEFDQIHVWVGEKELTKGYYVCAGADTVQTQEWHYLGSGWGTPAQVSALPKDDTHINEAEWYLVHYTYDKFEIVIPWLDNYTFTGKQDANQGYELKFDLDKNDGNTIHSESKFSSPVDVVLTYKASVGPGAAGTTVKNSAHLDWVTAEGESGPDDPETTETKVYNLGVTKVANDGTAEQAATRLAGAVFELYKDENCTEPVYVIPTNNTGVYILDDVDTIVSGYNRTTSREMYAGYWETYISESKDSKTVTYVTDENETVTTKMRRDMTTPANGQLVILGLEAGTYYLKETDAPTGYNVLSAAQEVTVGPGGVAGTYIDPSYKDLEDKPIQFAVSKIDIVNSKGVELPSTGGEGAMKMITIGSLVAMAFAVLLITHKKMSTYHD